MRIIVISSSLAACFVVAADNHTNISTNGGAGVGRCGCCGKPGRPPQRRTTDAASTPACCNYKSLTRNAVRITD